MKKDFIAVSDYSSQDIEKIIEISLSLKAERAKGPNKPILKDKVLANGKQSQMSPAFFQAMWMQ